VITMDEEWISVKEASELLGISRRQVLNRIHEGKLKAKRDNTMWLIHSSLSESDEEIPPSSKKFQEETSFLREQIEKKDQQLTEKDKQIEKLQEQLERANEALAEAGHRHDTVVMQMTKLLEYHQQPFWRKLFQRKQLPQPAEDIIISEVKSKKE